MGCASSKQTVADESAMLRKRGPRASLAMVPSGKAADAAAVAAVTEAQKLLSSNGSVALALPTGGLSLRYAYMSQRGYYPDSPDKANQDAVCAAERLGGADAYLWGVFDGHGEMGTECAQFTQAHVAANLASDSNLASAPDQALHNALVATNSQLHDAPIDDSLSGTTACLALLTGNTLYIANVGDSRAVLGERQPGVGSPVAKDLSQDQTPFRSDECYRVIKAGARVLTLDQLEGLKDPGLPCWTNENDCDGDPPRLWSPAGLFPGTAFTRSIGDSAAEDIGVIPDPEVSTTQLGSRHARVILATDGVWEFIPSQKAVDIVCKHDNPYDAARALVAQAYKLWLQKETRTDDISAVVLFLDWDEAAQQQQDGVAVPAMVRTPSGKPVASGVSISASA